MFHEVATHLKNLLHTPTFGILAYLIWHSLRVRIRHTARLATTTLTLVLIYALLDEWHQSFIPLRDASLGDVLNDLLGGVIAVWLTSRQPPRPARHA
ncbi:MAG: VanZ family protein [Candidatus Sedimenticola endophacoides]